MKILTTEERRQGWKEWINNRPRTTKEKLIDFVDDCAKLFKLKFWLYNWYKFVYIVKNIFRWTPIIVKDCEWDHSYLLIILRAKIKHMHEFHDKARSFVGVEQEIERMQQVIEALDRLIEEQYTEKCVARVYEKWGKPHFVNRPDEARPECYEIASWHENVKTERDAKLCGQQINQAYKTADKARQDDLDFVCNTLKKHLFNWWD